MAYKALDKAESTLINRWLDSQRFSEIVRNQIWDAFHYFAKEENRTVFDIFTERSPGMAKSSAAPVANDSDLNRGAEYLASVDSLAVTGFMSTLIDAASDNGTLKAIDGYSLYFGPIDELSPTLRHERMEFLNSASRRETLLDFHVKNGNIKNPHDLEEVALFLKCQAKKTQSSIAQLGQ